MIRIALRGIPSGIETLPVELKGAVLRVERLQPETGNGGFAIEVLKTLKKNFVSRIGFAKSC
jgi:hypothetical protein